jgi:hypothetical protein
MILIDERRLRYAMEVGSILKTPVAWAAIPDPEGRWGLQPAYYQR